MKAPLSATQLVNQNHFFSKTVDRIFMKFHTKIKFLKDKKLIKPGKHLIFGEKPKISLKVGLLEFAKICSLDVLFCGFHDAP